MACVGSRRGGGVSRRCAVHWLHVAKKKMLMALLHGWAFVTAKVLPVTSAGSSVLSATKLVINHLRATAKQAVSLKQIQIFVDVYP